MLIDARRTDLHRASITTADRERKAQLYLQYPDECPEPIGLLPYLIHPPSRLSSSAEWIAFRDRTLRPMMQHEPHEPNLPRFLKQVEVILAWRATVPLHDRFWKADQYVQSNVMVKG